MPHTISYLQKRFEAAGVRLQHRYGQNFLIDSNLLRLLVDRARLEPSDVVLEVGTGTGALTAMIAERAAAVVTAEIDPQMYQLASEELFGRENVTMLAVDALARKHALNDDLVRAVREQLAARPGSRLKLVANLPFCIATPLISNLLASEIVPAAMTFTIQKELADRITAAPSTREYGALSVWVQSQCRVELVRLLPPSVFWPRPKIDSAIVHVEVDDQLRRRISDPKFFHHFIRSLFTLRRKVLRTVLASQYKAALSKPQIDAMLGELKIAPDTRAEQLDVETILILSDAVQSRLPAVATSARPAHR